MTEYCAAFDVAGHEDYYASVRQRAPHAELPLGSKSLKQMERLGCFMEVLMQKGKLTQEMIQLAWIQAGYTPNSMMGVEALRLLCTVWAHGDELRHILPIWTEKFLNPDRLSVIRALTQNQAYRFIHDPNSAAKDNVDILTTIFHNTKLVDAFERCVTKSDLMRDSLLKWIPILNLKDLQVPNQAGIYQKTWREGIHTLCDRARDKIKTQQFARQTKIKTIL